MKNGKDAAFIERLPMFKNLPKAEVENMIAQATFEAFPKDTMVWEQGKTDISWVGVIQKGAVELFHLQGGQRKLSHKLKRGDTFGGLSILMNRGVALRSARVEKDLACFCIPKKLFIDLCTRFTTFYDSFADTFRQRLRSESYASSIAAAQVPNFLVDLPPFSFLPKEALDELAASVSLVHYPKDTVLFVGGQTRVEHLHIVKQGAAERYFEKDGEKILRGRLGEGNIFGGISMLVSNSLAVRSLKTTENTFFYLLPKEAFLKVCAQHEMFSEYFTNTFGKRMLDNSYAQIVSQYYKPERNHLSLSNLSVESLYHKNLVVCPTTMTIQQAAVKMSKYRCSSIFVHNENKKIIGVVTDNDYGRKVVATGFDIERPVADIMTTPLVTVAYNALVFEAMMTMMQRRIKHLAVTDQEGDVVGIITHQDFLNAQGQSPIFLLRQISVTESIDELTGQHDKLPRMIQGLVKSGAKPHNVTRIITTISDTILEQIIEFAIIELGEPPAQFAFMILGSEGRKEQTLKTDQDNAIIYENLPEERDAIAREYFLKFGKMVCGWLDQAGYEYCKGEVMAQNPKWVMPLSGWKQQFHSWIHAPEPEALLKASIFFDFRGAYGNLRIIDDLRSFLSKSLSGWPGFFRFLSQNALRFRPPIGFFRNFVVESKGEHRNQFDIKSAMMPIVDFARIYSLKHDIEETNTLKRLAALRNEKVLSEDDYNELDQAYSFLMQLRFDRQIQTILEENRPPDNYVNPRKLSPIQQTMLKEIFKRLAACQQRLTLDFIG